MAEPNQIGVIEPFKQRLAVKGGQQFARHLQLFAQVLASRSAGT